MKKQDITNTVWLKTLEYSFLITLASAHPRDKMPNLIFLISCLLSFFLSFFLLLRDSFIFFYWGGGAERESAGSLCRAPSQNHDILTWAQIKSRSLNRLSPFFSYFFTSFFHTFNVNIWISEVLYVFKLHMISYWIYILLYPVCEINSYC